MKRYKSLPGQLLLDFPEDDVEQLRSGEWIEAYRPKIVKFFVSRLRRGELSVAEDLTQEVLLKIHRHSGKYVPSGKFAAWAREIARNVLTDYFRAEGRMKRAGTVPFEQEIPVDAFAIPDESPRLAEALAKLPEAQRRVFMLRNRDGLSLDQIAERERIPRGTVRSRNRLAKEKLRNLLSVAR